MALLVYFGIFKDLGQCGIADGRKLGYHQSLDEHFHHDILVGSLQIASVSAIMKDVNLLGEKIPERYISGVVGHLCEQFSYCWRLDIETLSLQELVDECYCDSSIWSLFGEESSVPCLSVSLDFGDKLVKKTLLELPIFSTSTAYEDPVNTPYQTVQTGLESQISGEPVP